ncbi:MAG: hypothetical protein Unbinned3992contig1000_20 [Prokaryotic dsDNA virus sp.]|nr:MAG: hypothetical protein Unbinned3992contig1000_20 [Prokaryotic dsDNA virus sp.]|tara:strand:+ start:6080 stop:6493 length:414 start_codon:yes stop_codon:yes gene_type:complete
MDTENHEKLAHQLASQVIAFCSTRAEPLLDNVLCYGVNALKESDDPVEGLARLVSVLGQALRLSQRHLEAERLGRAAVVATIRHNAQAARGIDANNYALEKLLGRLPNHNEQDIDTIAEWDWRVDLKNYKDVGGADL